MLTLRDILWFMAGLLCFGQAALAYAIYRTRGGRVWKIKRISGGFDHRTR